VQRPKIDWRASSWIWPWLVGETVIGYLGRYGDGMLNWLPEWVDLAVVIAFSLVIFYWAVSLAMNTNAVKAAVEQESLELAVAPEGALA
jgi:hypothetical protein